METRFLGQQEAPPSQKRDPDRQNQSLNRLKHSRQEQKHQLRHARQLHGLETRREEVDSGNRD